MHLVSNAKVEATVLAGGSRHDQRRFPGRLRANLEAFSPLLLLASERTLRGYQRDVRAALEAGAGSGGDDGELWRKLAFVRAAIGEDTDAVLPPPFRMSGFVVYNSPVAIFTMVAPTPAALAFGNFANQSFNAAVNYFNRNAAAPMSGSTLALSSGAAVGSAMAVALAMSTFITRRFPPAAAANLLRWVAFPSSVIASGLNCLVVRAPELSTGIPVLDSSGSPVATSVAAAKKAVGATVLSRALLPAPCFVLPPLLLGTAFKGVVGRSPHLATPIAAFALIVGFGVGLPACCAIAPQMVEVDARELEREFWVDGKGRPRKEGEKLYYNRGI